MGATARDGAWRRGSISFGWRATAGRSPGAWSSPRGEAAIAIVSAVLTAGLTAYGVIEVRRHERNLARVPIRVHVNGTRGKSSVTRLIAAGLRAGGLRTFAKTTGTMARMIRPDGSEVDVYRVGSPNIIEQTRVVQRAIEAGAEALVVECMAVTPELQPFSELRLIRSTVGVITNARADHLDVMGPTLEDVAHTLAQTLPVRGHAFTSERAMFASFETVARDRGTVLTCVEDGGVSAGDLDGFGYFEHAENVALALAVCAHLGVGREPALAGMHRALPDPGVLRRHRVRTGTKEVEFYNAFAANDPDSTLLIWRRLGLERPRPGSKRIVLANCRRDRLQRSGQIAELVSGRLEADHVVLTGQGTQLVAFQAVARGLPPDRLRDLGDLDAERVYERVLDLVDGHAVVFGIGNIVGLGEEIVRHFRNREVDRG